MQAPIRQSGSIRARRLTLLNFWRRSREPGLRGSCVSLPVRLRWQDEGTEETLHSAGAARHASGDRSRSQTAFKNCIFTADQRT
jgi:hypothetical protein